MNTITTEDENIIVSETVFGIAQASSLNDISVVTINKETFDLSPSDWLIGSLWEWDSINHRMKIA